MASLSHESNGDARRWTLYMSPPPEKSSHWVGPDLAPGETVEVVPVQPAGPDTEYLPSGWPVVPRASTVGRSCEVTDALRDLLRAARCVHQPSADRILQRNLGAALKRAEAALGAAEGKAP